MGSHDPQQQIRKEDPDSLKNRDLWRLIMQSLQKFWHRSTDDYKKSVATMECVSVPLSFGSCQWILNEWRWMTDVSYSIIEGLEQFVDNGLWCLKLQFRFFDGLQSKMWKKWRKRMCSRSGWPSRWRIRWTRSFLSSIEERFSKKAFSTGCNSVNRKMTARIWEFEWERGEQISEVPCN